MPRSGTAGKTSYFVVLASICLVVAMLYFAQDVLIPVALAMLLSFLLAPLVHRLERVGLHRIPSVLTVVILMFSLIGVLGYVVGHQIYDLAYNIDRYRDNILSKIDRLQPRSGVVEKLSNVVEKATEKFEQPATTRATQPTTAEARLGLNQPPTVPQTTLTKQAAATQALDAPLPGTSPKKPLWTAPVDARTPLQTLREYLGLLLGPLGTAGIVIVFVIFMLLEREDLRDRMIRLIGQGRLTVTTQALDDASTRVSRYLTAQAIVNGTYGAAIAIGLWVIGRTLGGGLSFPNVVLWGLLCAILRFIPYLGPWIGAAFPLLISLAVYRGFGVFGATVGLFVTIELISNNFMEPWLYGSSTGISTVAILVAAVFWTWLWGAIGLLLSTPLTVVLVVMGKYVSQLEFLDILLGDEPVLDPPARLYQRLLALDQEEAGELVREYLDGKTLEDLYDTVMLPALAMAEQDRHRGNLDDQRQQFIHHAMRDIIEELGDEQAALEVKQSAAAVEHAARGDGPLPPPEAPPTAKLASSAGAAPQPEEVLPKGCTINVVCLPAHDEADEIVDLMLAQLLERRGYCAHSISQASLVSEVIEQVEKKQADVVVISALPPASVSHSRYLCKRVSTKFPEALMLVGLWTYRGDVENARKRITCVASVQVATRLTEMLHQIHQTAAPLVTERIKSQEPRTRKIRSTKSE